MLYFHQLSENNTYAEVAKIFDWTQRHFLIDKRIIIVTIPIIRY
jgi:hypothetical protein